MLCRVRSGALHGVDAYPVDVEVDVALGLPYFDIVGLPEAAVRESKVRVGAALKNAGYRLPERRITVNLAPADVRKDGTAFDLPIALGILGASGALDEAALGSWMVYGELSLSGEMRPVRGALPLTVAARDLGARGVLLPPDNGEEAAVVEGVEVRTPHALGAAVAFLNGEGTLPLALQRRGRGDTSDEGRGDASVDLVDVRGQEQCKRALEVAAAGAHNLLLVGPPGSGKTMLARRLATLLPELTFEEALETTKVYSVMGLRRGAGLMRTRPFRSPHHTISHVGLVGGGGVPRPGEVSMAHNGVLFLDELPEFRRQVLEVLRQPLEEGRVVISRALASVTYPGRFTLVAAMNPCPCGFLGDAQRPCLCPPPVVNRYRARISGPLLDRIDLHVEVPHVPYRELNAARTGEPSAQVRARVETARRRQRRRFGTGAAARCNAHMSAAEVRVHAAPKAAAVKLLEAVVDKLGMSARAHDRILKVARTIADLEGSAEIRSEHVAEAVAYRGLDRPLL